MKKINFLFLSISISMLTACSLNLRMPTSLDTQSIEIDHLSKNKTFHGLTYAQNIVENIDKVQAHRAEEAWESGVSIADRLAANIKGVDPYVGWSPKIQHPALEEHTKTKYTDFVELALLFDKQPVSVLGNDKLILLTMPQEFVWTFNNRDVSPSAKKYLEKALALIDKKDVRFSVYSQESIVDANYGKQWVSQAKAERFKQFVVDEIGVSPSQVQAFGLGSKIASNTKFSEGDFVQLVIYHKYNVDSSDYVTVEY